MEILTIETPALGDRSYVVTDGRVAAVIDPQRDLDRVFAVIEERGLTVTDVFETHVHNDYVTGGFELARRTGATYHLNADDELEFDHHGVRDGDEVTVGDFAIRVLHTPGHTPTHLSYAVVEDGRPVAVFTGGSLLYGSVGRTDLISTDLTEELTRAQFHSARKLAASLRDDTSVLPTHGFGSFCSSAETSEETGVSSIAQEKRDNVAFQIDDEDEFVRELMAGLDAYPAYYIHMGPANRQGPGPVDLSAPALVDPTELLRRIHAGEWVVDLRSRTAFAQHHLEGTINLEFGDQAATYLGWLIPWPAGGDHAPVTLIADTAEEVAEMQRHLVRIGIERPAGQARPDFDDAPSGTYRVADFAALAKASEDGAPQVLDVRRNLEFHASHVPGAAHVPLHELIERMDEVPHGEVWVHCQSGHRASIAASLIARAGRTPVLIDDDFDKASEHVDLAEAA
jgi:hydroxyacylglutathione hydrolase